MKFRFGDKVKVISGFYEGLEGVIDAFFLDSVQGNWDEYSVALKINFEFGSIEKKRTISENELELIEARKV